MNPGDLLSEFSRLKEPSIHILCKASRGILKGEGSLGIFPASFNPPTRAHVALIREARKAAQLDEILVLLDLQAMDKKWMGASYEDRVAMLESVFKRDPRVSIGVSNRGLFLDKIAPLRDLYPPPIRFTFIGGFDTILRVFDKKYYRDRKKSLDELFGRSRFLVANRDEYEESAFEFLFRKRESKQYRNRITFLTLPARFSFVSSSSVRERIAQGRPIKGLVPIPILRYISTKGFYRK
jgi:nicotinamide-nucleotide adenylyltransferase